MPKGTTSADTETLALSLPAPIRRGKASKQSLSRNRAAEAHQVAEAARLAGTPLNVLITAVPRLARRGFKHEGFAEPVAAFRSALVKLVTRHLAQHSIPALWVACGENAQGWGDHVHIALHVPLDRHANLLPKLEAAIRSGFDWDMDVITSENRKRKQLGHDHLVFEPVSLVPAEQFPQGEGFIDYLVKGAFESQGTFACTPLTISHQLRALASQRAAQVAHITGGQMHRTYAQDAYRGRARANARAAMAMLAAMNARASARLAPPGA